MRLVAAMILLCAAAAAQPPANDVAQSYRQELEANPRSSIAHFRLGQILRRQKDPQSAALEFNRALEGDREPAWIVVWSYINLGKIFQPTDSDRARQEFVLAVETGDNTAGAAVEAASLLRFRPGMQVAEPPSGTADDLPLPSGAYRVRNGVVAPIVTRMTQPGYSAEARLAGLEGTVVLTGVIDPDGSPRDMRVTRAIGLGLDEKAIDAIARWRFKPGTFAGRPIPVFASFAMDFRLPAKQSRWHLTQAHFALPDGASRPVFSSAPYPAGAGISPDAIDEGELIGATGRTASATVQFDIDPRGVPVDFQILNSSAEVWGAEAIRVARAWRFRAATIDGKTIPVLSTLAFAWGQRELPPSEDSKMPYLGDPLAHLLTSNHPPIVFQADPIYTLDAQLARIEGAVVISLVVNEQGEPHDLRVIESLSHGLDEAALAAVSNWKFQPIVVNGRAEAVPSTVRVDFRLPSLLRPRK
jgi:TonB family protein